MIWIGGPQVYWPRFSPGGCRPVSRNRHPWDYVLLSVVLGMAFLLFESITKGCR